MPQRRVRIVTQSGAGSSGSGRSFKANVEWGPKKSRLSTRPSRLVRTSFGALKSVTRARTAHQSHAGGPRTSRGCRRPGLVDGVHAQAPCGGGELDAEPAPGHPVRGAAAERPGRRRAGGPLPAEPVGEATPTVLDDVRRTGGGGGPGPPDQELPERGRARPGEGFTARPGRRLHPAG